MKQISLPKSRPKEIGELAYKVIDLLQDYPKGDQTAAIAVLFYQLCKTHEVRAPDALRVAENILVHVYENVTHLEYRALKEYMKNELT